MVLPSATRTTRPRSSLAQAQKHRQQYPKTRGTRNHGAEKFHCGRRLGVSKESEMRFKIDWQKLGKILGAAVKPVSVETKVK